MTFLKTLANQCINEPLNAILTLSTSLLMVMGIVCAIIFMVEVL